MSYADFLAKKRRVWTGEPAPLHSLSAKLKPFQADLIRWALHKGRCALWADTGLGKTAMLLSWADNIRHAGGRVIVLAPLAVVAQTVREAAKFDIHAVIACRSQAEADERRDAIIVTNYEMLEHFDASAFTAVVLDESSILKSYMGATKRRLVDAFSQTQYRLCCTATPAPNDYLELGNHAAFLGVMPSNEMIMRWFVNDPMEAGNYRLKAHGAADFWRWVSSWALSLTKPSDIGYPDENFILPPLSIHQESVGFVEVAPTDGRLFVSPEPRRRPGPNVPQPS